MKYLAESLGTFFLVAVVVGSGIMAENLANGNNAVALLGNTIATGAILFVLIKMFGSISGAHFNPAVSFVFYLRRELNKKDKHWKKKKIKAKVIYDGPVEAPIKKDQVLAKLKIIYDQEPIGEYDLLAIKEVKKVNIFTRLIRSFNYLIWGDV